MNGSLPSAVEQRWQEVLRRAAIALKGAGVGVWEADERGRLRPLAASDAGGRARAQGGGRGRGGRRGARSPAPAGRERRGGSRPRRRRRPRGGAARARR